MKIKLIWLILLIALTGCEEASEDRDTSNMICEQDTVCEMQCYINNDYNTCISSAAANGISGSVCDPVWNALNNCLDREL